MTLVASMPPTPATAPLAAVRPARRAPQTHQLLHLQRAAGNRAVAQLLSVQRCGSTPPDQCPCHQGDTEDDATAQRVVVDPSPLRIPVVQRHSGFRTKPALQTEVLNTPALQNAASAASLALEVGQSSGDPVRRLQEALTAAGFPVAQRPPSTPRPNRPTPRSSPRTAFRSPPGGRPARKPCRRWTTTCSERLHQRHHRPTARQYEPGEREASLTSPGKAVRSGGLGNDLRLTDFAAGRGRMKPEHEAAVRQLIKDFDLFEPDSAFEVEFVRGFTDPVDAEEKNVILREERATDVSFFLRTNAVPGAPEGQAAAEGSYDAGCDPATRSDARAVLIRLRKRGRQATGPETTGGPPAEMRRPGERPDRCGARRRCARPERGGVGVAHQTTESTGAGRTVRVFPRRGREDRGRGRRHAEHRRERAGRRAGDRLRRLLRLQRLLPRCHQSHHRADPHLQRRGPRPRRGEHGTHADARRHAPVRRHGGSR